MVERPSEPETPPGVTRRRLEDGSHDDLIREEPLVIHVAGEQVVTMRTPGDDENLAIGFLLSEGVADDAAAITDCMQVPGDPEELRADAITLHVEGLAAGPRGRLTRTHEIRSSCGLCGLTNPDELLEKLPPLLPGVPTLSPTTVEQMRADFEAAQVQFRSSGASHSAAIFGADGAVWGRGEDVGRHNALDKAIGCTARAGHSLEHGIALLSGRAGFDLALKCVRVRIPVILSVSAASAQSYDLCRAAGATLVGFVRPGRMRVYTAAGRLTH